MLQTGYLTQQLAASSLPSSWALQPVLEGQLRLQLQ